MRRGEIWTVAGGPDYAGKPRPALIIQSDLYRDTASVTVCGFTSNPVETEFLRPAVMPNATNGLREASRIMVDKVMTVPRSRLGERVGRLEDGTMQAVDEALMAFIGLT